LPGLSAFCVFVAPPFWAVGAGSEKGKDTARKGGATIACGTIESWRF